MPPSCLDAALLYAARGWRVIALHTPTPDGGCSCGAADCDSPGKHPRWNRDLLPSGLKSATTDAKTIRAWWRRWPDANVGIATGEASNLYVLDSDWGKGGDVALIELQQEEDILPRTARVQTGSGEHFYFAHPGGHWPNTASALDQGVDTRGDGGYVVAPPSLHANGRRYTWIDDTGEPMAAADADLATLPGWVRTILREEAPQPSPRSVASAPPDATMRDFAAYAQQALADELATLARTTTGGRNNALNRAAFNLGQLVGAGLLDENAIAQALGGVALGIGLKPREIEATIRSGLRDGIESPRDLTAISDRQTAQRPAPRFSQAPEAGEPLDDSEVVASDDDAGEGEARPVDRVRLCEHPETGVDLYLPLGCRANKDGMTIWRMDAKGNPVLLYPGRLIVSAIGVDLATGHETLTVQWASRSGFGGEVVAPRAELAQHAGAIKHLAPRGMLIHDGNAGAIVRYLAEFAHENAAVLPQRAHVERLGLIDDALVLPAGAIGFEREVRYAGRSPIRVGKDADAYKHALAAALGWKDAWTFWAIVALGMASPALARLRPRRNPALYIAGDSGSGKTTVCQFAGGVWGDPTRAPMLQQAARTTQAGFFQSLEHLGGLPMFVDEAHTALDPAKLEGWTYQFANGETYTRGGKDGKAIGGSELAGALLLAGEALPVFRHAGSSRRVLWVDGTGWPPLGAGTIGPPGTPAHALGAARAALLEASWENGSGLFGHALATAVWRDWKAFREETEALGADPALEPLQAWRQPLAIAAAILNVALKVADCSHLAPPEFGAQLLDRWAELLAVGQETTDPAVEAWEQLVVMLAQADERDPQDAPGWRVAHDSRSKAMIACRKRDDDYWRVLTGSNEFCERIGKSAAQLHGRSWLRRGWIVERNGKTTFPDCLPNGSTARVLRVPIEALKTWSS